MKPVLTTLLLFISIAIFSQTSIDSISTTSIQTITQETLPDDLLKAKLAKSEAEVQILKQQLKTLSSSDSLNLSRINNIESRLGSFYKSNRTYHILYGVSVGLIGLTYFNMASDNNETTGITLMGAALTSLIGTVIYIDSFKYLNFNKKTKKTPTKSSGYNSYYY